MRSILPSYGLEGLKELLGNVCDALIDLLLFVQFKKREKHPRRVILYQKYHSFMAIFHVLLIVKMVPHRAKHLI